MEVAGEVAKRLSFGSTTSSGGANAQGKKRVRDDDSTPSSSHKKRAMIQTHTQGNDNIFSASFAAQGPPTPIRQMQLIAKSPGRSPALRRMLGEQNVKSVQGRDGWNGEEMGSPQRISLGAFLEMAGVEFMEGLPGGVVRRRCSVGRGILGQSFMGGGEFICKTDRIVVADGLRLCRPGIRDGRLCRS
jgi:kinetochore protein Spc7/SPC105